MAAARRSVRMTDGDSRALLSRDRFDRLQLLFDGRRALIVVEGSHRDARWLRPHDTRHPLYDASLSELPPGAVSLALRAGRGVAFTNRTAHGSPPGT